MNVLGYIFAILVLVSIAFQSYYTNCLYDQKIQQSYNGYQQACKNLQKVYIEHNFKQIPEKSPPKGSKTTHPNQGKTSKKKRIFLKEDPTPSCMRLNLWPILKEKNISHCIYQSFIRLIIQLYSPHIIDPKDVFPFAQEYLTLLSKKIDNPSSLYLEQIQFSSPAFQRAYYQMLSSEPSLLNYIKVNPDQKICIACSDEILLEALFNQEIKNRCTQNRKDPMHRLTLSKDLLEKWIRIYGLDPSISSYIRYKHSKKDSSEKTLTGKDLPTEIVLKQKVSSFAKPFKTHEMGSKL